MEHDPPDRAGGSDAKAIKEIMNRNFDIQR